MVVTVVPEQYAAKRPELSQKCDTEWLLDYQRRVQEFQRQKTPTGEVQTADPVNKFSVNVQIKVPEPKLFDGGKCVAKSWLK